MVQSSIPVESFPSKRMIIAMNVALGFFALVIFATMMVPGLFGLQNFRQWAGMYVDNWCRVTVFSGVPMAPGTQSKTIVVGRYGSTYPVWTAPSHNQYSCARWAHDMLCGEKVAEGWTVTVARPFFMSDGYFLGETNVCLYPFSASPWFVHAHR